MGPSLQDLTVRYDIGVAGLNSDPLESVWLDAEDSGLDCLVVRTMDSSTVRPRGHTAVNGGSEVDRPVAYMHVMDRVRRARLLDSMAVRPDWGAADQRDYQR